MAQTGQDLQEPLLDLLKAPGTHPIASQPPHLI